MQSDKINYEQTLLMNGVCPMQQFKDIITIEPGKRGGKPCIRGMRITVYDVLEYLASGMSEQEILQDFPYLTKEDILACLGFAAARERMMVAVQ
jgi:uncharacterized protein (DUF433 family)